MSTSTDNNAYFVSRTLVAPDMLLSSKPETLPLALLFVAPPALRHGLRVLSQLYAYILNTTCGAPEINVMLYRF